MPSTFSPSGWCAKTPPCVSGGEQVVQRHEPELAGMGRRTGDQHTPRLEQRLELLVGRARPGIGAMAPASGSPISTRASTATGAPSGETINGLTSTLATSGRSTAAAESPTSRSTSRSRSTAASPRNSPSSFCVASRRSSPRRRSSVSGAGRNTTSAIASARMPPTPSMTVAPNCGSRTRPTISSRLPAHHRRDQHADVTVVGGRCRQQFGRAASTAARRRRASVGRGHARSCGRSRRRRAWRRPGSRFESAAATRLP